MKMDDDYTFLAHIREVDDLVGDIFDLIYETDDASPGEILERIQDAITSLQLAASELSAEADL